MMVNSPDKLDFTDKLPKQGSMHASTPMMLEMVAVGAMAMQLEFRMPSLEIFFLSASQSKLIERSTST